MTLMGMEGECNAKAVSKMWGGQEKRWEDKREEIKNEEKRAAVSCLTISDKGSSPAQ